MKDTGVLYEVAYELVKLDWLELLCIGEDLGILNRRDFTSDHKKLVEMIFMKSIEKEVIDKLKISIINTKKLSER